METVELGSYEKCQDLRALLKRKHRFILLRSPGNKVGQGLLLTDLTPGQGLLGKVTPGRLSKTGWAPGCKSAGSLLNVAEAQTQGLPQVGPLACF